MKPGAPKLSKVISPTLAFYLEALGADLFYRRVCLAGLGIFAILAISYDLSPISNEGPTGLSRSVPLFLVLFGWVRAFMYVRSKGV